MLQLLTRPAFVFHIGQIDLDQSSVSTPALRTQMFLGFNQYKICWRKLMKKLAIIGLTLIGSTMLCAVPLSLHFSQATVVSVALDTADARVGRPATPGSVAGVARRSARRCARGVTC
jgi:hypothetical protein